MKILSTPTIVAAALALVGATVVSAPAQAAPATRHVVSLSMTSNGSASTFIAGNGISVSKNRSGHYTRSFTKQAYTAYVISASTNYGKSTRVSCTIKVDGKVKKHKSASGDFASVSCSWPY